MKWKAIYLLLKCCLIYTTDKWHIDTNWDHILWHNCNVKDCKNFINKIVLKDILWIKAVAITTKDFFSNSWGNLIKQTSWIKPASIRSKDYIFGIYETIANLMPLLQAWHDQFIGRRSKTRDNGWWSYQPSTVRKKWILWLIKLLKEFILIKLKININTQMLSCMLDASKEVIFKNKQFLNLEIVPWADLLI